MVGRHAWQGACVAGRGWGGGHVWQDGGDGMLGEGVCMAGGMCGEGCAWHERQPLQRTVRILLECILVISVVIFLCS